MLPAKMMRSKYRKEMWNNVSRILKKIEKTMPITEAYALGSFATKKKRPADVDFILLLKTKSGRAKWSADLVIAPDNRYGKYLLEDAKLWMKQKYGAKKSEVIRLK